MDGDIYYNPLFCDLWIRNGDELELINEWTSIPFDSQIDFVLVGHIDYPETTVLKERD